MPLPDDILNAVAMARSLLAMEHSLEATLADAAGGAPHETSKLDVIVRYLTALRAPGSSHDLAVALVSGSESASPDIDVLRTTGWKLIGSNEALDDLLDEVGEAIDRSTAAWEAVQAEQSRVPGGTIN
ncbi:MAG TPA: hypothetical protein VJ850_09710 [Candidatus Limnocylindrales bacterium]|nr:hypothetical protein [Candidatus Limnocylindrales bacterium]